MDHLGTQNKMRFQSSQEQENNMFFSDWWFSSLEFKSWNLY